MTMVVRLAWYNTTNRKASSIGSTCSRLKRCTIMNSTDSLDVDERSSNAGKSSSMFHHVDTMQEGAEIQDSPHDGSLNSSSISSPPSAAQEKTSQPASQVPFVMSRFPPGSVPPNHHILVDPTTGQHYLVPTAQPQTQPQIIYQPMYYSPTPAQPLYYPAFAGGQGAYLIAAPISASHSTVSTVAPPHYSVNQRYSGSPPSTSVPASLPGGYVPPADDNEDLRSLPVGEDHQSFQYHRRLNQIRNELISESGRPHQIIVKTSPPPSPVRISAAASTVAQSKLTGQWSSPTVSYIESMGPVQQKSSSSPSSPVHSSHEDDNHRKVSSFGAPPVRWRDVQHDVAESEHRDVAAENTRGKNLLPQEGSSAKKSQKPIRMDIDFSMPIQGVEIEHKQEKAKSAKPSTAFAVTFDSNTSSPVESISLQEAAAKNVGSRRFLRRSAPGSGHCRRGHGQELSIMDSADPKQYLLKKMLMGCGPTGEMTSAGMMDSEVAKDIDALSDAGTYIVEDDSHRLQQMVTSQTLSDSDDEITSDDSETAKSSGRTPTPPPMSPPSTARTSQVSARLESGQSLPSPDNKKSSALLREMMRMGIGEKSKCSSTQPPITLKKKEPKPPTSSNLYRASTSGGTSSPVGCVNRACRRSENLGHPSGHSCVASVNPNRLANTPALLPSASSPKSLRHVVSVTNHSVQSSRNPKNSSCSSRPTTVAKSPSNFRRVDGGRFSMRSNLNSSSANNRTPLRPPFKVGNVANSSTQGSNFPSGPGGRPKETPEMTAWLRRKDYNPMKAAAEAKKANTLKQRGDQFTSNRSVSFHQGAAAQSALLARIKQEKIRARHNVTQDDLLHDEEACGPETILASFSRGINKDLNRLKHSEEPAHNNQAQSSSLERAVRQLAVKCQRSITLIKNVHHGELSASIENLLLDIDPPKNRQESISEQLERLSEAFDAIQKYLEVSSLSGSLPASPSAVSPSTTAISFLPNAVQSTSSEAGEGVQNNSTPES